ncbi:putative transcription factor C2H2 family [Helianthus annuus]|uniref:RING-type E3 ubiquitin transferase n=2 Tax=Helianthus annuus TaxID=4232 RepID=A0A9K3J9U0_HELAN|nr:probable E3 ubiquitin-protein ligase ZFP1 [Helianthus annuus]KAF5810400.1 putative transcription factor C2H2 family [Helianthus annuus]KAJ0589102.1 putative transcription factor C2H2 family [Helianthus annuus]KAJ0931519.1 putative transcription factor C2H2 family [Helianthus annuus]
MDPQSVWAMDPYYYHQHPILQQQYYYYYAYAVPAHYTMMPIPVQYVDDVAILNTMWVNQEHPMHSYFQNQNYVPYPPPEETSFFNTFDSLTLDETSIMQEIEEEISALQGVVAAGTSGSGLSEEEISEHLHVYSAQGKMSEVDACCICLGEYEKKEKMGRLECGHRFHAKCIRRWLLSKNVCPMCRSTAMSV